MAIKVFLQHPETKKVKIGVMGFSWTTFFFGLFVPFFRGDWKVFIFFFFIYMGSFYFAPYTYTQFNGMTSIMIEDNIGIYSIISTIFYFVVNILGAFFYNRIYTKSLISRGYRPLSAEAAVILSKYCVKVEGFITDCDK